MNVSLNTISKNLTLFFNEQVFPTSTQKKILIIAAAAFACLAAYYLIRHFCCKAKALTGVEDKAKKPGDQKESKVEDKLPVDQKVSIDEQPLSYEQLIQKAKEYFASDPEKDEIIKRIEKRLKEQHYEEQIKSGKKPSLVFSWEDANWATDSHLLKGEERTKAETKERINARATHFLNEFVGGKYLK